MAFLRVRNYFSLLYDQLTFFLLLLATLKPIDYESDSITAPCVLKLCAKYFKSERALKGSLVIINLVPNPSIVQARILSSLNEDKSHNLAVMVKDAKKPHRSSRVQEKAQNYFMLLQHYDDLQETLTQLKNLPTWNPLAQIVVQFTVPFESEKLRSEWVENLFIELLSHDALKVNVMYQFRNDTNKIQVETWFPYHNKSCARKVENIRKIEECVVDIATKTPSMISYNQQMYPLIPKKLHGCSLKIATVIWEPFVVASEDEVDDDDEPIVDRGLEVLMLHTITEGMQMIMETRNVNKERASRMYSDNNKTGLYSKLLLK